MMKACTDQDCGNVEREKFWSSFFQDNSEGCRNQIVLEMRDSGAGGGVSLFFPYFFALLTMWMETPLIAISKTEKDQILLWGWMEVLEGENGYKVSPILILGGQGEESALFNVVIHSTNTVCRFIQVLF